MQREDYSDSNTVVFYIPPKWSEGVRPYQGREHSLLVWLAGRRLSEFNSTDIIPIGRTHVRRVCVWHITRVVCEGSAYGYGALDSNLAPLGCRGVGRPHCLLGYPPALPYL